MIHRFLPVAAVALLAAFGTSARAAPCPTTTITPAAALPSATVGVNYTHAFTAANTNALPFQFSIASGLPPASGFTLKATGPASADLIGAPSQAGNYVVTVAATDTSGCSGGRTYALSVAQGAQTIGFGSAAPSNATVGGAAYAVIATATSGLPVALSIDASANAVCSIAGSSVTFLATGTCTINANQTGDANYAAAPQVQQSFAVGLASQTIAFTSTAPGNATVGGAAYAVAATATSGLAVAFTIDASASSVCAIAGSSVTFQNAGTCTINANQPGNATYNAAPQAQQSFTVGRADQTIAFTSTAPAGAVVGGATYTVAATATSGLAVTFAIDAASSAVCSLAGTTVSFTGNGTCTINANQAGNATYNAAPQAQQNIAVGTGNQAITYTSTAPTGATFGGATYTVTATATSGLPVTFTIDAAASAVCAIAGSTVSFTGAGTCVVNANQAGNGNWNPAPQAQQSFVVGKASQTVAFTSTAPTGATSSGATYTVTATATSGLPVSFTIDAASSAVCTIAGSTVSFTGAGTCTIYAIQVGDANWNAAPQTPQSFAVAKASQTITYTSTAPSGATFGGVTYTVTATATSGLPVTFTIDATSSAVCAIAGSTVSFTGAGTCAINANQAGNANWNAAPQAQQSFAVARASQTVAFASTAPAGATFGGPTYTVAATATSGLAVTFSIDISAAGVCTIAGSTVSMVGTGTCVVNANQAGNTNWNAAPQAQQSFAIAPASQTITYTSSAPTGATFGGPTYTVTATATSGLPVAFTINAVSSAVCSLAGSTVSFIGTGTCVIDANQAGNANWNPAPPAQQSFAVAPGSQTIAFTSTAPAAATFGGATYTVAATATSGMPVTFSIDAASGAVCSIAGSTVSFTGAGTCTINANQAGSANWNPAPQAQQSFAVGKAAQAIAFTSTAPVGAAFGDATAYTATATATSGLPVTFSIDAASASVCSIAGNTVSVVGAGTCVINANQPGDMNWAAAPQAQQSFAIAQAPQTITFTSTPPTTAVSGTTYDVAATATSGLPVAFTVDASATAVCSIAGATVTFNAAGTCVINANQAGDANWAAASLVQQSMSVITCLSLAVGEVANGDMPGAADICIANSSGGDAEYTYIPINFAASSEAAMSVVANNIQAVTGPPSPRPANGVLAPLEDIDAPDADAHPHAFELPSALGRPHDLSDLVPVRRGGGPLTVGQLIDLNASIGGCTAAPSIRKGRVEAVSPPSAGQQRMYAVQEVVETNPGDGDWHPPLVGGYLTLDFQNFVNAFVAPASTAVGFQSTPNGSLGVNLTPPLLFTGAMDVASANFGALTDLDLNEGVIVFFTRTVNALSPPATVAAQGLFQPRDLFSAASCGGSNEGEILYMLLPDPTGTVNANVRQTGPAYQAAMPTLVHHYTHLLSAARRLYHNGAAPFEEPWLDEAIAYAAQELVFFNTSGGLAPRGNIQLSMLTTGPFGSRRVAAFNMYANQAFGALRNYFYNLSGTNGNRRAGPLRQLAYRPDTTPTRHDVITQQHAVTFGFLRYMLDRKNTGDAALLNALVNSTDVGMANLQAVMNDPIEGLVRDFLVAAYTDDAVAGIAPQYMTPSWNFRSVYGGLGGFPLSVHPLTNALPLALPLGPGGGAIYHRFGIAAGQVATVTLTQDGGTPTAQIRTAIVRTK